MEATSLEPSQHPFLQIVLPRMAVGAADRVLELGSGNGWACRVLAARTSEGLVVGIDTTGDRIREARRLSSEFENILYIEAEAEEIPWQDNFFSHAIVIDSLNHMRDLAAAVRQMHRVLCPGGQLWIVNAASEGGPTAEQEAEKLASLLAGNFFPGAERVQSGPAEGIVITARKADPA